MWKEDLPTNKAKLQTWKENVAQVPMPALFLVSSLNQRRGLAAQEDDTFIRAEAYNDH